MISLSFYTSLYWLLKLGNDHPDTLTSIWCLTTIHVKQNKLSCAEPFYEECDIGFRRVLGDGHPTTKQSFEMYESVRNNVF